MTSLAQLPQQISPAEIDQALAAIADLMIPAPDLSLVSRDDLGTLIRILCVLRAALARA